MTWRPREAIDAADALLQGPLNNTVSSERGTVVFTMEHMRRVGREVLFMSWPTQMSNVQSGQYFRVHDA